MKKILAYISVISALVFTSCSDLDSLNNDPKKPLVVPGEMVFSSAQKNLFDIMTSNSINLNVFRLLAQQQAGVTYIDESRYDLATRNIPQNFWQGMYRDVLKDLSESKRLITAAPALSDVDQAVKDNKLAIIDISEAYSYFILVTAFGNLPYTDAMNSGNLAPAFDDQKTVYMALLDRLKTDIEKLDATAGSFGTQDIIYGGNIGSWVKFANALRIKMALFIVDVDNAKAVATINEAVTNTFTSNADNFRFPYKATQPNTNPIWVDLVNSKRTDFVPANTLVDIMNTRNDPRRPFYFTTVGGVYKGGVYGSGNSYDSYSHVSAKVTAADFEALLLDYAEVEFLLAEVAARGGFTVSGTAEEHYTKAITASIKYWGGSDADVTAYLAQPTVAYATAAGTWAQKIGTQKYIALYNRGYDAWLEWRRLDYPIFNEPANITYDKIPVRLTYPVSEQNLNQTNYEKAAAAIGGDEQTTKLFWDK